MQRLPGLWSKADMKVEAVIIFERVESCAVAMGLSASVLVCATALVSKEYVVVCCRGSLPCDGSVQVDIARTA